MKYLSLALVICLFASFSVQAQNRIENFTDKQFLYVDAKKGLNELNISNIHLLIYPTNYLRQYHDKTTITGFVELEKTGKLRPDMYWMFINLERSDRSIKKTLFHELIHVQQHYNGSLEKVENQTIFNGQKYFNKIPYKFLPWEIEARSKGKELLNKIIILRGCCCCKNILP